MGNAEKLLKFGVNAADVAQAGAEKIESAMLVLQDEALIYLYVNALVSWLKMLPPDELVEFGTQAVVTVLFDVLVGIVLTGGAGIAVRYSAKVATTMTRAAKQQARMAKLAATLIAMSKKAQLGSSYRCSQACVGDGWGAVESA